LNIGMTEIVLIIVIAVCVIKPENSGKAVKALAGALRSFREAYGRIAADAGQIADDLRDGKETDDHGGNLCI